MSIDRQLSLDIVRVTEQAAVACFPFIGRGDEKAADQAAVDAMRNELNHLDICGEIVIGEGERDEAPMLYIGEKVGTQKGVAVDIALDPLEGTTLTAKAMANALAVIAVAEKGSLLNAPDTYMHKIAIGGGYPEGVIDLDATTKENIESVAKAKGVDVSQINVCVLERERHETLIQEIRQLGARVSLITDGDVAAVMHTTDPRTTIDMYMGIGGAPEGVLAAAALSCIGGQMQGRLMTDSAAQKERAKKMGVTDFERKYTMEDMVRGEVIVSITGVTDGTLVKGVCYQTKNIITTDTVVLRSTHGTVRRVQTEHHIEKFEL